MDMQGEHYQCTYTPPMRDVANLPHSSLILRKSLQFCKKVEHVFMILCANLLRASFVQCTGTFLGPLVPLCSPVCGENRHGSPSTLVNASCGSHFMVILVTFVPKAMPHSSTGI